MQPGLDDGAAGLQLAGDLALVELALRAERDDGGVGIVLVVGLDWGLQGAEGFGVHGRLLGFHHQCAAPSSDGETGSGAAGFSERSSAFNTRRLALSKPTASLSRGRVAWTVIVS